MQTRSAHYQDLQNLELTHHVMMLVEDWNEPDKFAVGTSSMFIWRDIIFVSTPVTMNFVGGSDHPDSITISMVVATYTQVDMKCIDIAVFDPANGELVYATDTGKNR